MEISPTKIVENFNEVVEEAMGKGRRVPVVRSEK